MWAACGAAWGALVPAPVQPAASGTALASGAVAAWQQRIGLAGQQPCSPPADASSLHPTRLPQNNITVTSGAPTYYTGGATTSPPNNLFTNTSIVVSSRIPNYAELNAILNEADVANSIAQSLQGGE